MVDVNTTNLTIASHYYDSLVNKAIFSQLHIKHSTINAQHYHAVMHIIHAHHALCALHCITKIKHMLKKLMSCA